MTLPIKLDLALTDIHLIGNALIQGYPPDTNRMRKIGIYLKQLVREIRDELRDVN